MATSTFVMVCIGITAITVNLMKVIAWLDHPQPKRSRRAVAR